MPPELGGTASGFNAVKTGKSKKDVKRCTITSKMQHQALNTKKTDNVGVKRVLSQEVSQEMCEIIGIEKNDWNVVNSKKAKQDKEKREENKRADGKERRQTRTEQLSDEMDLEEGEGIQDKNEQVTPQPQQKTKGSYVCKQDDVSNGKPHGNRDKVNGKEIYFNCKGTLKKMSEIDVTEMEAGKKRRFEETHLGPCKVRVRLTRGKVSPKQGKNFIKIWKGMLSKNIRPAEAIMSSHATAEVKFENSYEANSCLDKLDIDEEESGLKASIDIRAISSKGVITDWPDSIMDLWEAMEDHSDVIKMERMFKKRWNKEERKYKEEETENIIITSKGENIKEKIGLWDNRVFLKVRPYVSPVKQCFKCFRYGHIKAWCKSEERCIICGDIAHGRCDRVNQCRNCGDQHRSIYRGCREYERNRDLQVIMAYHNVSYVSATRIMEGREKDPVSTYDRYEAPEQWPKVTRNRGITSPKKIYNEDVRRREGNLNRSKENSTHKEQGNKGRGEIRTEREIWKGTQENDRSRQERMYQRETRETKQRRNIRREEEIQRSIWNTREGEIEKQNYGIAIGVNQTFTTSTPKIREKKMTGSENSDTEIEENCDVTSVNNPKESILNLLTKLMFYVEKDDELRRALYAMLERPASYPPDSHRFNNEEDEEIEKNVEKKKKEKMKDEERRIQRMKTEEIKRNYWRERNEKIDGR